jgi:NTP pyrophosphatase (non-canonical NTP hydrolase)
MRGSGDFSIGAKLWPGISKLIEEAGEVLQVAGKLIAIHGEEAHWDGSNLRQRLQEEMGDLTAALLFVAEACGLDERFIQERAARKLEQFRAWHREQQG